MATYVNDLRLKEIATGDESGTWGTSTNTNLELIGEAFSYGTEAITTNADTHTTTIADGSTDPGRSMYLKYTGTLDSACTITIGPNTVSKVWIIENGTSGSQNIILSQGSGANITIPAGDTKVVYSDGAGAGAAFFDAFASLNVGDLTATNITGTLATAAQPNITSVGTLTGFTSTGIDDNADATAITIDSSENVGIGVVPAAWKTSGAEKVLQIDTASLYNNSDNNVYLNSNWFLNSSGQNVYIESDFATSFAQVAGNHIWYGAASGTAGNTATLSERMRIDTSGFVGIGTTSPRTNLHIGSGSTGEQLGLLISRGATTNFLVCNDGTKEAYIGTDASNAYVKLGSLSNHPVAISQANGIAMYIDTSKNVGIGTSSPDADLHIDATSQGNFTEAMRISNTGGGANEGNYIQFEISNTSGYGPRIGGRREGSGGSGLHFYTGEGNAVPTEKVRIDHDGNVGIGTTSPSSYNSAMNDLVVAGSGDSGITIASGTSSEGSIGFADGTSGADAYRGWINYNHANNFMRFFTNASERLRIAADGKVGIGTTAPFYPLDVNTIGRNSTGEVMLTAGNSASNDYTQSTLLRLRATSLNPNSTAHNINGAVAELRLNHQDQAGNSSGGTMTFHTNPGNYITGNLATRMTIAANGSIGAPTGTNIYNASDERLKQNISTLSNGIDVINALNPVQFNWIDNFEESENGKNLYGFIAQEVQEVFPDAVENFGNGFEVDGTVIENPLTVRDKFFIPVLVKALQEQQTLIESLTARITTLEG